MDNLSLERPSSASAHLDVSQKAYEFDAHYDPAAAKAAERAFVIRPWRELRRLNLLALPALLCFALLSGWLSPSSWAPQFFWVTFALSVIHPFLFFFLRSAAAERYARQFPVRQVQLAPSGLSISAGKHRASISWHRFKYVWHAADHLLLVLGAFACVAIPLESLPSGAQAYIEREINPGA